MLYGEPDGTKIDVVHGAEPPDMTTPEHSGTVVVDPAGVSVNEIVPVGAPPPIGVTVPTKVTASPTPDGLSDDVTGSRDGFGPRNVLPLPAHEMLEAINPSTFDTSVPLRLTDADGVSTRPFTMVVAPLPATVT